MAIVIIDGHEIEIGDNERLNCIQAAERAGVEIPHYCWHPGLSVVGSCRMCLVEIGSRDPKTGKVSMQPKLVPACNTPATDGTVIVTESEKVQRARAIVEEELLLRHAGVCTGCSVGCSIWVEENQDRVWRIKPRDNPHVNRWWICNDGRYGYHHVHDTRRLVRPGKGDESNLPGHQPEVGRGPEGASHKLDSSPFPGQDLDWTGLPGELNDRLRQAGRLAAVLSPFLSVEEAYLLAGLVRGIDPQASLALGPVPTVGEDEHFPGGFTIAAEKCPNRRGVEAVLAHFTGGVKTFEQLLAEAGQGGIRGAWVSGGYKSEWIDEATARRLEGLDLLIVQDLFASPLSERATYVLPGATFAERDGSYVNRGDRLQSVPWAVRPPAAVRPEGPLYCEMLGRQGLYDARAVLSEVAAEILYFAAAGGDIPDVGIDLKVNLLADDSAGHAGPAEA